MLSRWPNSSYSTTCIGFPVSYPCPESEAASVTPAPWLSPCSAVEKNALRRLRPGVSQPLRQAAPTGPRSLLWRQTRLSCLFPPQGPVRTVWGREKRTPGLAGRQSAVHQAVRLLRGPPLSPDTYQGSGRRTLPRLARRQGTGQAVPACATPPRGNPGAPGHRHRRDRRRQGAEVHAAVALGEPQCQGAGVPGAVVQGQPAAEQGLPPQGVVRSALELLEPRLGTALLRPVAGRPTLATAGAIPALRPHGRS